MKKFVTWQRERRLREMSGCPSDRFHFDRNNSVGRDYEKDLLDLSKLATTKYHNEFFRFLESLADQNNDQELREAVTTSSRRHHQFTLGRQRRQTRGHGAYGRQRIVPRRIRLAPSADIRYNPLTTLRETRMNRSIIARIGTFLSAVFWGGQAQATDVKPLILLPEQPCNDSGDEPEDRRVFYIDVSHLPIRRAEEFIDRIREEFRKNRIPVE
jgi:hypothetical protein